MDSITKLIIGIPCTVSITSQRMGAIITKKAVLTSRIRQISIV